MSHWAVLTRPRDVEGAKWDIYRDNITNEYDALSLADASNENSSTDEFLAVHIKFPHKPAARGRR